MPLRQTRTAILFIPGLIVIGLSTSRSAITQVHFHYATHFVPYLFIAAIIALAVRPARSRRPALAAGLLGALVLSQHFGAFFRDRFRTSFHEVGFVWTEQDARRARDFAEVEALIPARASVCSGEYEGPHLARRRRLTSVKEGVRGADYVVYSSQSLRWGGLEEIAAVLRDGQYGVVAMRGDFVALSRGKDTRDNAVALQRL